MVEVLISSATTTAALIVHAWFAAVATALPTLHDSLLCSFFTVLIALNFPGRAPVTNAFRHYRSNRAARGGWLSGVRCTK